MATRLRRFFYSPLRVMLIAHLLSALATGGIIAAVLIYHIRGATAGGVLGATWSTAPLGSFGKGGTFILWAILAALLGLMLASFLAGLVYGRWGLPGRLQSRAVFYVPPLAAVYFMAGTFLLYAVAGGELRAGARQTWQTLSTSGGLTLLAAYVAFSTAAVGLGWAAALAITDYMRRHGRWETIGYFDEGK